jgi:hypothetical protein
MSHFTLTVNDGQQPSQLFKLQSPVGAEDIVSLPLLQQGYYLLNTVSDTQQVSLSRQGDTLRIHADASDSSPAAIIPGYYTTPSLLTVPMAENKVLAVDTADVQETATPVELLTATTPDVPGAPGFIIIDGVTDNEGPSTGEIANKGMTDDLTPTLHGSVPHGEGMQLIIYANTVMLGSVIVDSEGNWSFTPENAFEMNASYTFEVLFQDAGGSTVNVAMPFTIITGEDGSVPAEDIAEPGNRGTLDIIGVDDNEGPHTGNVDNGGITDDLTPTLHGHEPHAAGQIIKIYANTVLLGSLVVGENGDWSFPTELAANSQYTFEVLLQDAGGNAIVTSMPYTITTGFDYATPAITSAADTTGIYTGPIAEGHPTDETNPTLTGTSDPGVIINIYDGDALLGSTTADASGNWTFTPTIPLTGDGEHLITATASDGTNETGHSTGFIINLDTVCEKPVITSILDDVGNVTGNILENGNITDDGHVIVSGTSEPGSTITLFFTGLDNAIESIDIQPNADGTWSVPVDFMAEHGEGTYTYWVLSYDEAGNKAVSDKATIEYSTTPPDAATDLVLIDDVGTVTGPIISGDVTDDNQPEYQGHAEPGTIVIISDNGAEIGSAVVDEKGNWSFTPETPLEDGEHSFSVVVEDGNGLHSDPSESIDFTVDTIAPAPVDIDAPDNLVVIDDVGSITGPIDKGGVTDDANPTFTGQNQTPGDIIIIIDNGTELGSAVVDENGKWSFTPEDAMADGEHDIELIASDTAGNRSEPSAPFDFVVDTIAPDPATNQTLMDDVGDVTGPIISGDVTDDSQPEFSGKAEPGATVIISDNGTEIGTATVDENGNWSFTPETPLADGEHSFSTIVEDAAGNQSQPSESIDFIVDTIGASITLDSVVDDVEPIVGVIENHGVTNDDQPTLNGTATADSLVNIYDNGKLLGSVMADAQGNWSYTTDALSDGEHSFTATVTTISGESAPTAEWAITVDTIAPAPVDIDAPDNLVVIDDVGSITGPIDKGGVTDDANPTFTGQNQTPGDIIIIIDNGTELGSAVVDENGKWSFTPEDAMADGEHDIELIASDTAGNRSEPSAPFDFVVDTIPPDPASDIIIIDDMGDQTGIVVPDGATDDNQPTFDGNAEPGTIVIINDNGETIGSVVVDDDGHWSFTPDEPLDNGEHTIDTVVVDPAGNESEPSDPISFAVVSAGSENFEAADKQVFNLNETVVLNSGMAITSLVSGRGDAASFNEITSKGVYFFAPETYGEQTMTLLANSVTRIEFGGDTNYVSFDVAAVSQAGGSVHYFDANGNELGSQEIPVSPDKNVTNIAFEAPEGGPLVSYITVTVSPETGNSLIRVDNFEWGDVQVVPQPEALHTMQYAPDSGHEDMALMAQAGDLHAQATADAHHEGSGHLSLTLDDVISQGAENLFINDGTKQFAVTGDEGDKVELTGVSEESLVQHGNVTSGGVVYDVYSAGDNTELLIQQGLELHTTA